MDEFLLLINVLKGFLKKKNFLNRICDLVFQVQCDKFEALDSIFGFMLIPCLPSEFYDADMTTQATEPLLVRQAMTV